MLVNKVRRYYNTKKATAKHQGIPFELELRDIYWLLYCARISVEQIGKGRDQYQLARFGDTGPYAIGNCRFITKLENLRERAPVDNSAGLKAAWARDPARKAALAQRNRDNPWRSKSWKS